MEQLGGTPKGVVWINTDPRASIDTDPQGRRDMINVDLGGDDTRLRNNAEHLNANQNVEAQP